MTQKLFAGDLVYVAKDLGPSMSHFENDQQAIVLYSYAEKYGGNSARDYTQFSIYLLESKYTVSWYNEDQLTLIEPNRFDLLPKSDILRRTHEANVERNKQLTK